MPVINAAAPDLRRGGVNATAQHPSRLGPRTRWVKSSRHSTAATTGPAPPRTSYSPNSFLSSFMSGWRPPAFIAFA